VAQYFPHPNALVETDHVGPGTRISAFAHVMAGAVIGRGCNVGDHCLIENRVRLGNQVVVMNGVSLCSGVTVEDRVFVGPNATFTNHASPRAKVVHLDLEQILVRQGASIGANATLLGNLTVGRHALIGAGSVVTRDVPDFALVYGNPARQRGWGSSRIGRHSCQRQPRTPARMGMRLRPATGFGAPRPRPGRLRLRTDLHPGRWPPQRKNMKELV
jgi:UDP-2-acetamido-3-amino-2,3-dideoxy-glucuronate N-acetyltransferase